MTTKPMATIGLIAAVLQVADIGLRLSNKLATFKSNIVGAEESIGFICKDISHTSSILGELGQSLEKDYEARTCSENIYRTTYAIANDCRVVFQELDEVLADKLSKLERARDADSVIALSIEKATWLFLQSKIEVLWGNLEKLKSTLLLTLNVVIYAKLVNERAESQAAMENQRVLLDKVLRSNVDQLYQYKTLRMMMETSTLRLSEDVRDLIQQSSIVWSVPEHNTRSIRRCTSQDKASPSSTTSPKCATHKVEDYCNLVNSLLRVIETADDSISHDMRLRMRGVIVESHKRETRLLKSTHGPTELKDAMRGKTWTLAQTKDERDHNPESTEPGNRRKGEQSAPAFTHAQTEQVINSSWLLEHANEASAAASEYTKPSFPQATGVKHNVSVIGSAPRGLKDNVLDYRDQRLADREVPGDPVDTLISADNPDSPTFHESFKIPSHLKQSVSHSNLHLESLSWTKVDSPYQQASKHYNDNVGKNNVAQSSVAVSKLATQLSGKECEPPQDPDPIPHSYTMEAFLNSTEDPLTRVTASQMSPALGSWPSDYQQPGSQTEAPLIPDDTSPCDQPHEDPYHDLVTLTSTATLSTTESEATSEGERCLDSCALRLQQETWFTD